ncbi:MAG: YHYH domain-containing protein [Alphaproteobacteria bacterium]|nr:YHYH domain-containing protein [Alphaproteobacteria bacterium]
MNTVRKVLVVILSIAFVGKAFAHGGGLDKNRCHHNRKNGTYHCH